MKCNKCIYYQTYYYSGIFSFIEEGKGICSKHNKQVGWKDTCDCVKSRPRQIATVKDVDYAMQALKEIIDIYR